MKKSILFTGIAIFGLLISFHLSGQCVPDENCVDINEPGEICPANLPQGVVGLPYAEVITIIPPSVAFMGQLQLNIAYILIDSVKNLPPGITYTAYNEKYYPDTAYCIDVEGTPTTEGEYQLAIYVTPFVYYNNVPIATPQVANDSSVVMTVIAGTGINPYNVKDFRVFKPTPNPFNEQTQLGFYMPYDAEVELKIFNILGEEVYKEIVMGIHGENYFRFNGSGLDKGVYFYGLSYQSKWYPGKLIKN